MTRAALITGGAGFIGTNLAHRLLTLGRQVIIYDNLSRPGVGENLAWLRATHPAGLDVHLADLNDAVALRSAVRAADEVYHLAAQVAVTTSLLDPLADFEVNARGTLTLLEAVRAQPTPPSLVFTSTNKVYGGLDDVPLAQEPRAYRPLHGALAAHGIGESRPIAFRSPYGCSKGAADQYVLDYAHSFDLPTVIFRMSCIYGPHQRGTEDQGWVAHFLLRALDGEPITIYGDGRQVRDLLYVDDLVRALLLAQRQMATLRGQAFNIGGGPAHCASLLEVLEVIGQLEGAMPAVQFEGWRVGDQRWYVSDVRRFEAATGWAPEVGVADGLARLYAWARAEREARAPAASPRGAA